MKKREFYNRVTNSSFDIIEEFLNLLSNEKIDYVVIGGMAINAYCEPMVTLDFDCVVEMERVEELRKKLKEKGFKVKTHPHTYEVTHPESDIRIQIQRDKRYQPFIKRAEIHEVLGYKMKIATKEDLLYGKQLALKDKTRSKIKREKDRLDIHHLIERFPELKKLYRDRGEISEDGVESNQ